MENNLSDHPLKVALYLRVSTDDQAEKYGLDLQREAVEALVKSKGKLANGASAMTLAGTQHVYVDDGVSGTTILDERPAFARLKEDVVLAPDGQRPFDVVAVYKIDRFARKLKILLDVIDFFEKHGIQFISANESIDTSTPFGKAMLGIIGVIAELEIETIKQRTQDGRAEAYKRGVIMGSAAVFGYTKSIEKTFIVLEEEAIVIRLIFDKFLNERHSPQQIANFLKGNEYLSPDASAVRYKKRSGTTHKRNDPYFWRPEQVREILEDEVYTGKYYYHKFKNGKRLQKKDWMLSPKTHTSIIDLYPFEKAQLLLGHTKYASLKSESKDHLYLLSGLLKCDNCKDQNYVYSWTGSKKKLIKGVNVGQYTYSYICERKKTSKHSIICTAVPLPAEPLEKYIVEYTKKLLSNPLAVFNHQIRLKSSQKEIENLRQQREDYKKILNGIPSRIERLKEQHQIGIIDTPTLQKEVDKIKIKRGEFEKLLENIELRIGQNSLSQEYLMSLDLFSQKYQTKLDDLYANRKEIFDILHILIDEIIVYSRPVTKEDVIAGKKRENQAMPYRLELKLRLPQDILQQLDTARFGVKNANL